MPELELYDSDVIKLERVLQNLAPAQKTRRDLEGFRQEIVGRFAEAGYQVRVNTYLSDQEGTYIPEIEVEARIEPKPFDHDRMTHEVRHDLLGFGEGGTMKAGLVPQEAKDHAAAHRRAHRSGRHAHG